MVAPFTGILWAKSKNVSYTLIRKKITKTFLGSKNYVLCMSLLKIKMQRQYFHIEKAKQEENSFKLFRGKMNWAFPIRLKYLKH